MRHSPWQGLLRHDADPTATSRSGGRGGLVNPAFLVGSRVAPAPLARNTLTAGDGADSRRAMNTGSGE